jgi:hypothetical protein
MPVLLSNNAVSGEPRTLGFADKFHLVEKKRRKKKERVKGEMQFDRWKNQED